MSTNRVIGRGNALPWRLSADMKHFKAKTLGKPVIMGRKTFESIGRALPGRENIVVTRHSGYEAEGIVVVHSVEDALDVGRAAAARSGSGEIMVIGGAQIYSLLLDRAHKLYVTEVHGTYDGDAHFPEFDRDKWVETHREFHAADTVGQPDCSFVELQLRDTDTA